MKKSTGILMALMQFDIGGAETHVVELSKELVRRGYRVVIASNGGVYEKEVEDAGIKHYKVPLQNKNPLNVIKAYKTLERIIKTEDIDIVHSHARIPSFILGILRKKLKFPFITSAHWVFNTGYGLKYITNWGERTVAVSDDIKKYLMDNYNTPEENIFVTINGIDLNKFSSDTECDDIRDEFGISPDDFCIVGVSRMDKDRSLASKQLISIAPKLKKLIPNLKILVVGGGNDEEEAKTLAKSANDQCAENVVSLAGARTDINKLVAVSSLFVGVSRAVLEAMAAAKNTIVAGNEGYIGLFDESKLDVGIQTNFCCRGCEPTVESKLYEDIISFYNKTREEKESMGAYCRKTVADYYSVEKMTDDYVEAYDSLPSKNLGGVLISGYYGFGNSGDDALLQSIINEFRKNGMGDRITVLSSNPAETSKNYGVKSIGRANPFSVLIGMMKCRLFISGGGTLIQDGTSTKSLLYYLWLIKLALIFKKKVMLYANGIGPVNKQSNRTKCKNILNKVDAITVRDKRSYEELGKMGINKPRITLTADPVFLLKSGGDVSDITDCADGDFFCISVRRTKNMSEDFESAVAEAVDRISSKHSIKAVFLPLQGKDIAICEEISSKMQSKSIVVRRKLLPEEIMNLVSRSCMCVGMRLHMLIYAAAVSTPLVGIVYDPKVSGFMEYANQNLFVDSKEVTADKLFELIDSCIVNKEEISTQLVSVKEDLYKLAEDNSRIATELYKCN